MKVFVLQKEKAKIVLILETECKVQESNVKYEIVKALLHFKSQYNMYLFARFCQKDIFVVPSCYIFYQRHANIMTMLH